MRALCVEPGVGGVPSQAILRGGQFVLQGIDEVVLMVPPQPRGTVRLDQIPDQIHRCGGYLSTVDQIPAEHQMVVQRQRGKQIVQRLIAAMQAAYHPVPASAQVQGNNLYTSQFWPSDGPKQSTHKTIRTNQENVCAPAVGSSPAWLSQGFRGDTEVWHHRL